MEINNLVRKICEEGIVSLTFSNKRLKSYEYNKVNVMKLDDLYQISKYTETQVFHENIEGTLLEEVLLELFTHYKQVDGSVMTGDYNIRVSKKGKVLEHFKEHDNSTKEMNHNRSKNYILKNYEDMEILKDLKIVTQDNKIVNNMHDKFKQINKYIELVDDLIKKDNLDKIKIVDFGSGKSYLTFALYDYLENTAKINVEMIGIDLKKTVIEDNIDLAQKYAYDKLSFIHGDINDIEVENVDMMISLHACDIATDLALNKALEWNVKYIVSVPCCHHEVYQQITSQNFSKMLEFNIIKERMSALITDSFRANVLEYSGYQTQVIEYINSDHSLKNVMIRARFTGYKDEGALQSINNIKNEYQIEQKLLNLRGL